MMKRTIGFAGVGVLLGSALLYSATASASPQTAPPALQAQGGVPRVAAVEAAEAASVAGTVRSDIGGVPTAVDGARVAVWWVPDEATAAIGAEVPIESLGEVTTGSDGTYSVPLESTTGMVQAAAANGGHLNLEIGVVDEGLDKVESSTVQRKLNTLGEWAMPDLVSAESDNEGPGNPNDPEAGDQPADWITIPGTASRGAAADGAADSPVSSDDDPAPNPQGQSDFMLSADSPDAPKGMMTPASKGEASRLSLAAETPVYTPCSYVVDARPIREVNVVEFHNATNSNGKWTYGESADSNIEGAIDYSGDGGWSIQGSRHIGNVKDGAVYRSYSNGKKANNYGTTDFTFVDGHYKPLGIGKWCTGTTIPPNSKAKRVASWYGSARSNTGPGSEFIGCANAPQSGHRNDYPKGSGFIRKTKSAAKITGAVNLGPIKVGAQSGYSNEVKLEWNAVRGRGIWLCGTNYEPLRAGVIHAQNRP